MNPLFKQEAQVVENSVCAIDPGISYHKHEIVGNDSLTHETLYGDVITYANSPIRLGVRVAAMFNEGRGIDQKLVYWLEQMRDWTAVQDHTIVMLGTHWSNEVLARAAQSGHAVTLTGLQERVRLLYGLLK